MQYLISEVQAVSNEPICILIETHLSQYLRQTEGRFPVLTWIHAGGSSWSELSVPEQFIRRRRAVR